VPPRLPSVKAFDERDIRSKHSRCSHDLDALWIAGMGAAIARPFIADNRAVSDVRVAPLPNPNFYARTPRTVTDAESGCDAPNGPPTHSSPYPSSVEVLLGGVCATGGGFGGLFIPGGGGLNVFGGLFGVAFALMCSWLVAFALKCSWG
jgi:hypothetical protein